MFKKLTKLFLFIALISISLLNAGTIAAAENGTIKDDGDAVNGGVDDYQLTEYETMRNAEKERNFEMRPRVDWASRIINYHIPTQEEYYYCAPAATSNAVNTIAANSSMYRTQTQMAIALHTTSGGTDAGPHVATALNNNIDTSKYWYTWVWYTYSASSVATVKSHLTAAIDGWTPPVINTFEEVSDGFYYQGHGKLGSTLYHYGMVGGYENYGNTIIYLDPGHGYFDGFVELQRVSIDNVAKSIGGRGYVW